MGLNTYAYVPDMLTWVDPLGWACWSAKEVAGRKFYQRSDLFDPHHIDAFGRTNIQRMKKGDTPIGRDGLKVNVHHLTQDELGSMAEILSSYQSENDRVLHMYSNQWDKCWVGPDGVRRPYNNASDSMDRRPFNKLKKSYWKVKMLYF